MLSALLSLSTTVCTRLASSWLAASFYRCSLPLAFAGQETFVVLRVPSSATLRAIFCATFLTVVVEAGLDGKLSNGEKNFT